MESASLEKHKGYYGGGSAGGGGYTDETGDGSGDSDGHGRNYTKDLNEFEIMETGYGRGKGDGGGGGGDSHPEIFYAVLESDRLATSADFYKGDGKHSCGRSPNDYVFHNCSCS